MFRVVLRMEVTDGLRERFEQVWRDGAQVIAREPANIGQWLSRSDTEPGIYYIVSDWSDEPAFRDYELSERHTEHRARLHPYRTAGSMTTMTVLHATAGAGAVT